MWSSLISAGGSLLGSSISSAFGSIGAIYAAKKSDKQARQARHWMKMMSDTAHQREVKDLRAAGLNPILSAGGNGAASASSAPMPYVENPLDSFDTGIVDALNTANSLRLGSAEVKKVEQDTAVSRAEEERLNAETTRLNLENESLRLENAIKQGVYDPGNPMYVEKNIARGADGILNIIASSVPSMPYSSEYVKSQLARYLAYSLDNTGKSTSNQILARNLASLPSAADARFNETWLPRINSGLDIVDSLLDIFNFAKGMKNSSAKGKGGKKK